MPTTLTSGHGLVPLSSESIFSPSPKGQFGHIWQGFHHGLHTLLSLLWSFGRKEPKSWNKQLRYCPIFHLQRKTIVLTLSACHASQLHLTVWDRITYCRGLTLSHIPVWQSFSFPPISQTHNFARLCLCDGHSSNKIKVKVKFIIICASVVQAFADRSTDS